jgi:penicillin-binding protein 2
VTALVQAETGAGLPGLQVRSRTERRIPRDPQRFAPHLIGWLGARPESWPTDETDAADLEEEIRDLLDELELDAGTLEEIDRLRAAWQRAYRPGELRGQTGVEQAFEDRLRGSYGWEQVERDRGGRELELLDRRDPVPGLDVTLTIDAGLQQYAEELLDGSPSGRGAVVALDPWTGEVLVLATAPRFMLSELRSRYEELTQDPGLPLFNRAIRNRNLSPPGSVFKAVTAVAALEEGMLDPDERVPCQGYLKRPDQFKCRNHAPGLSYDLRGALAKSCNVYFYRLGERLGQERLTRWARSFGFGERTGIGLAEEQPGAVEVKDQKWDANQGRLAGIGQYPVESTPLQVAVMMATIATDGRRPRPRLLLRSGGEKQEPAPPIMVPALAETWRRVREGLRAVVEEGSAARPGLKRVRAAGKTGTPQSGLRDALDHAWFAGYAPADQPVVAFAVFVESTLAHGGEAAAPIAESFLTRFFESRRE